MYTLNEILTLIENEATAHLQVKQYGHGDVWEINPKELDYLVLWAIEESVVLSERTLTYNIRLLAMDRVLPGEENEQGDPADGPGALIVLPARPGQVAADYALDGYHFGLAAAHGAPPKLG